jgi:hypothetical protein
MTQVKFHIYNYGSVQIADFKNHYHDAVQCMKAMNDGLIANYGKLPDSIFYYITYKIKQSDKLLYYVDSNSGLTIDEFDKRIEKLNPMAFA